VSTPNLSEIRLALNLAADALNIASDWNMNQVQINPPREWKLPGGEESAREGWCTTDSLAAKLRKIAKTIKVEGSPS